MRTVDNRNRIVLGSGSPRRKELLEQIGVEFDICRAEGEETITSEDPVEAVKELALQKAQEVSGICSGRIVIGADTVVASDGRILGKPKDREEALRMLQIGRAPCRERVYHDV